MDPVISAVAAALSEIPMVAGVPADMDADGGLDLFVGFSGGMDSTVLLHAAARLAAERRVRAIHVNHQLHADAPAWEAHCQRVCAGLGVPLEVRRVTVAGGGSLEAAARDARYEVFSALAGHPGCRLLLAHHRGDQAETVLLRLLQGRGLYGMPARRALGRGELLRPLLALPRAELAAYARRERLTWVDDPSNADERLDRNYLRRRILPALRERWQDADEALLQAMGERELVDRLLLSTSALDATGPVLPLSALAGRPLADQAVLLRLWLQGRGEPVPSHRALVEFLGQLGSASDRQPTLSLEKCMLRRFGDALHQVPPPPRLAERYTATAPGRRRLPHGELRIEPDPQGVALRGRLEIRFRRGGERLLQGGHHRSLKQLFQEARIPPWRRGVLPLLYDEDGLAAVPGIALRDAAGADGRARFGVLWLPVDGAPWGAFH